MNSENSANSANAEIKFSNVYNYISSVFNESKGVLFLMCKLMIYFIAPKATFLQ